MIASKTDGPCDILGAGGTRPQETLPRGGLLYPQGVPEALAEALSLLIKDKESCAAAGLAGNRHITEHYSLEKQAQALDAILTTAKR